MLHAVTEVCESPKSGSRRVSLALASPTPAESAIGQAELSNASLQLTISTLSASAADANALARFRSAGLPATSPLSPFMRSSHHAMLPSVAETPSDRSEAPAVALRAMRSSRGGCAFDVILEPAQNPARRIVHDQYAQLSRAAAQAQQSNGLVQCSLRLRQQQAALNRLAHRQARLLRHRRHNQHVMQVCLASQQQRRIARFELCLQLHHKQTRAEQRRRALLRQRTMAAARHTQLVDSIVLAQKLKRLLSAVAEFESLRTTGAAISTSSSSDTLVDSDALDLTASPASYTCDDPEVSLEDVCELSDSDDEPASVSSEKGSSTRRAIAAIQRAVDHNEPLPLWSLQTFAKGDKVARAMRSILPPINRFTLRELDVKDLIGNAQLRHDLYFNAGIHFSPNMSGETGQERKARTSAFWAEMEIDISARHLVRLPLVLAEIRCVVGELLPHSDEITDALNEHLDIELAYQQLAHNAFNAVALMEWLGGLLKQSCAPVRDAMVDESVALCRNGQMCASLRQLFTVLELMKLDSANHALETLRPFVLKTGFAREWSWFQLRFQKKKTTLDKTLAFFAPVLQLGASDPTRLVEGYHAHVMDLVSSAHKFSSGQFDIPETFELDVTRLIEIYNDIQDVGVMASLLLIFRQASRNRQTAKDLDTMKNSLWVLLNDPDITVWNIVLELARVGGDIRGSKFSDAETRTLNGVVEGALSPSSKLFGLVKERIRGQVVAQINALSKPMVVAEHMPASNASFPVAFDEETLTKLGLVEMRAELTALTRKLLELVIANKGVYGRLYLSIAQSAAASAATLASSAPVLEASSSDSLSDDTADDGESLSNDFLVPPSLLSQLVDSIGR